MPDEITLADLAALIETKLAEMSKQLDHHDEQLHAIGGQVDRLGTLADQAEKFLHNPIGAYKAARGKLIPRGPAA